MFLFFFPENTWTEIAVRRLGNQQPTADMDDEKTANTTTTYNNNIPLPSLTPSVSCPDSDRCDTTGVSVPPPRRSDPVISRFCPTLGWLHLVKSVTHRTVAHVALAAPIVLNVPNMWNRDEDNLLLQTMANTIPLNDYNPWNQVSAEIPGHLPQQYREC